MLDFLKFFPLFHFENVSFLWRGAIHKIIFWGGGSQIPMLQDIRREKLSKSGSKFPHRGGGSLKWPKKFRRLLWMAPFCAGCYKTSDDNSFFNFLSLSLLLQILILTDYGRPMKPSFIEIPNFWAWEDNLGR